MPEFDWLTARPIAHRGLHDAACGVVENTATAVTAAITATYAIEVDLQVSADGEAMVYHDDELGRLTQGRGRLDAFPAAALRNVPFNASSDRMLTLGELIELIGERAAVVLELKSHYDGDRRLVGRVAELLRSYAGPIAAMSFDPEQVAALRHLAPWLTRGIIAEHRYDHSEWQNLAGPRKFVMANLLHGHRSRPQFVAYAVRDLPAFAPRVARALFGLPLLTWTVRTEADRRRARDFADQMIFEGFRP